MAAAVVDHGGGEAWLRGMVMWLGGTIATRAGWGGLYTAAEGVEQQPTIAALHHAVPQAREPYGSIAKVVGFPATLRQAAGTEEGLGDVAIARLLNASVERAQREHQAFTPGGRECRWVVSRRAAR